MQKEEENMNAFSLPLEESPSTAGATKLPFCPIHSDSALLPSTSPRLHAPNRRDEHANNTPFDSHYQNALSTIATRNDDELQCAQAEIARLKLQLQRAELAIATKAKENARLISQLHDAENAHSSTTQLLEDANATIARLTDLANDHSSSTVQQIEETNAKTAIYNLPGVERRAVVLLQIKHHFSKAWMKMKKAEGLNNKANPFSIRNLSFTHRGSIFLDIVYNSGDVNLRQDFERKHQIRSYFDPGFFDIVDGYQLILESNEQRRKHYSDLLMPYAATIIQIRIKSRCNETNRLRDMSHLLKKAVIAKGKGSRERALQIMKSIKQHKIMALLELALWKANLDDVVDNWSRNEKEVKRARYERRITSRASIVIINVLPFLEV